jgi:glyoxylase-like metal-dependent hydrolase (beta-lactamase superfamily II)
VNTELPDYQLFAIRYATREARRSDHFIGGDPHDGPMPMDYFVWAVVGSSRVFLVDTGFTAETAARRKRQFLRCPIESLREVGLEPDSITDVVLTHLHYDHFSQIAERALSFAGARNGLRYRPPYALSILRPRFRT